MDNPCAWNSTLDFLNKSLWLKELNLEEDALMKYQNRVAALTGLSCYRLSSLIKEVLTEKDNKLGI